MAVVVDASVVVAALTDTVAEEFSLPLATLDRRLARASGIRCEVRTASSA